VSAAKLSHATSLLAVSSQLSISTGVAISAFAVELAMQWHGHARPTAEDFPLAFLSIAAFTALAFFVCLRLPANAGSEMANRAPAVTGRAGLGIDVDAGRLEATAEARSARWLQVHPRVRRGRAS